MQLYGHNIESEQELQSDQSSNSDEGDDQENQNEENEESKFKFVFEKDPLEPYRFEGGQFEEDKNQKPSMTKIASVPHKPKKTVTF